MGADATLVNAAYAAAMANVPGDWSKHFNKAYEGLLLAHNARYKMFGDITQKFGEETSNILKEAGIDKELREAEDLINLNLDEYYKQHGISPQTTSGLAIDNAKRGVEDNQEAYKNNINWVNTDIQSSIQDRFESLKKQIKDISAKSFPSKEDKRKRTELYKDFEIMKNEIIQNRASAIQYHDAGFGGENSLLNWDRMRRLGDEWIATNGKSGIDPDLITLIKHVHDPKVSLEDYGIRTRWDDKNELIIDYFEGRLGVEYINNNGGNINTMTLLMGAHEERYEKEVGSLTKGPKVKSIRYRDLMGVLKYKATGEEAKIEAIFENVRAKSSAVIKGTSTPVTKSWDDVDKNGNIITGGLKSRTKRDIISELKNKDVLNDLATRELFGTNRIYENDVAGYIDVLTYQKILGKDVSKFDINKDNEISRTELSAIDENFLSEEDKKKIKEVLINPQNESELITAQNEFADYLTDLAEQHFDNNRPPIPINLNEEINLTDTLNNLVTSWTSGDFSDLALPYGHKIVEQDGEYYLQTAKDLDPIDVTNPTELKSLLMKYAGNNKSLQNQINKMDFSKYKFGGTQVIESEDADSTDDQTTILGTEMDHSTFKMSQEEGAANMNQQLADYKDFVTFQPVGSLAYDRVAVTAGPKHPTPGEVLFTMEFDYNKEKNQKTEMARFNDFLKTQDWYMKSIEGTDFDPDEEK